jgi:hypothetical protein
MSELLNGNNDGALLHITSKVKAIYVVAFLRIA